MELPAETAHTLPRLFFVGCHGSHWCDYLNCLFLSEICISCKVPRNNNGFECNCFQLASQSGYVSINWAKINKDVGKISNDVNKKFEEYSTQEHEREIAKYFKKVSSSASSAVYILII